MIRFHILHIFETTLFFFNFEINEYFLFFIFLLLLFFFFGGGEGVGGDGVQH